MSDESCAYKFALLDAENQQIISEFDISMDGSNISSDAWSIQSVVLPQNMFGDRKQVYIALIPKAVKPQDGGGVIIKDVKHAPLSSLMKAGLWDVNDVNNIADDEKIAAKTVAWIDAHTSEQEPAPRMPQLELRTAAVERITGREPEGARLLELHVQWQLHVEYNRPTGGNPDMERIRSEDIITIRGRCKPVTESKPADKGEGQYRIFNQPEWIKAVEHGFFGGSATLSYVVLPAVSPDSDYRQSFVFSILGRNPDEARCKAYIQSQAGAKWFYHAIAKHESKGYNGARFYNQFWEHEGKFNKRKHLNGEVLWCSDGPDSAGGFGLFQVTGRVEDVSEKIGGQYYNVDRNVLWNWQANVTAACDLIGHKYNIAMKWMSGVNGQRLQAYIDSGNKVVNVPDETVAGVTFSDTGSYAERGERFIEDAVAMKAYNGAPSHYCAWMDAKEGWKFSREVISPNGKRTNYVLLVCQQVEEVTEISDKQ